MDVELTLNGKPIGQVNISRQGLYYVFHCRCRLPENQNVRLLARCGEKEEDLGVLVPMDGGFGLDTRRPVKRLGEGSVTFALAGKPRPPRFAHLPGGALRLFAAAEGCLSGNPGRPARGGVAGIDHFTKLYSMVSA